MKRSESLSLNDDQYNPRGREREREREEGRREREKKERERGERVSKRKYAIYHERISLLFLLVQTPQLMLASEAPLVPQTHETLSNCQLESSSLIPERERERIIEEEERKTKKERRRGKRRGGEGEILNLYM